MSRFDDPDHFADREERRAQVAHHRAGAALFGEDEAIDAPEDLTEPCGGCGARPGESCTDDCPTRAMED